MKYTCAFEPSLQETKLEKHRLNQINTDSLITSLNFCTSSISNLKIAFNDTELKIKNFEQTDNFNYEIPYILNPTQKNTLLFSFLDSENLPHEYRYDFILVIQNPFNEPIEDSEFFILSNESRNEFPWVWVIEENKIKQNSFNGLSGQHPSLVFSNKYEDVEISFEVELTKKNPSLVFYFLGSNLSFVPIHPDVPGMVTLLKGKDRNFYSVAKEKIQNTNQIQSYRITKEKGIYTLEYYDGTLENAYNNWIKVIRYDLEKVIGYEPIGFSTWPKSGGLEITNLQVKSLNL